MRSNIGLRSSGHFYDPLRTRQFEPELPMGSVDERISMKIGPGWRPGLGHASGSGCGPADRASTKCSATDPSGRASTAAIRR
jgi:hypothetical protein